MLKKIALLILFISSCTFQEPTEFSETALNDTLLTTENTSVIFKEVIDKYKGKTVFIDFWASWCGDCIRSFPAVKRLQLEYPEVTFLFLSVDQSDISWKRGIQRFNVSGEHYNLPKGMKDGDLVDFVNLSWIPRYMIIDKEGKIKLFNAIKTSDPKIAEILKN